jgi:hypothetical protein
VVTAQAVSDTAPDAAALGETIQFLANMARTNGPQAARAAIWLQNLTVSSQGQVTTFSLSVPEEQLEQAAKNWGGHSRLQARPAPPAGSR